MCWIGSSTRINGLRAQDRHDTGHIGGIDGRILDPLNDGTVGITSLLPSQVRVAQLRLTLLEIGPIGIEVSKSDNLAEGEFVRSAKIICEIRTLLLSTMVIVKCESISEDLL